MNRTDKSRAVLVGRLIKSYRMDASRNGARLTQDGLLDLMASHDSRYAERYDRSSISHYERGARLAPKQFLIDFGNTLGLSEGEIAGLLDIIGPGSPGGGSGQASSTSSLEMLGNIFGGLAQLCVRVTVPSLFVAFVGYILLASAIASGAIALAFIAASVAVVVGYSAARWRRSRDLGDLQLLTVFLLLNAPFLQYLVGLLHGGGPQAVELPEDEQLLFRWATGVGAGSAAILIVAVSLQRLFGSVGSQGDELLRVWLLIPAAALLCMIGTHLGSVGVWSYGIATFALLALALMGLFALMGEGDHLGAQSAAWAARLVAGMVALIVVATLAVALWSSAYPDIGATPYGNVSGWWEFEVLGLRAGGVQYEEHLRSAFVWMGLMGVGYSVLIAATSALYAVYLRTWRDTGSASH